MNVCTLENGVKIAGDGSFITCDIHGEQSKAVALVGGWGCLACATEAYKNAAALTAENTRLRGEVAKLRADARDAADERTELTARIASLVKHGDEQTNRIDTLENDDAGHRYTIKGMLAANVQMHDRILSLTADLARVETESAREIMRLGSELGEARHVASGLRGEMEEVRSALLRYYEISRTRPESVSTADIAHMARKEVEALRIMVDQFLSERDMALADLARVSAECKQRDASMAEYEREIKALTADLARVTGECERLCGEVAAYPHLQARINELQALYEVTEANRSRLTAENARPHGLLEYNACRCDDIAEDAGHLLVWVPSEARALIGGIQIVAQQIAVSLRAACTEGK